MPTKFDEAIAAAWLRRLQQRLTISVAGALSACGAPYVPPFPPVNTPRSTFLDAASYFAFLEQAHDDYSYVWEPGDNVVLEKEPFDCRTFLKERAAFDAFLLEQPSADMRYPEQEEKEAIWARWRKDTRRGDPRCTDAIADTLTASERRAPRGRQLVILDGQGRQAVYHSSEDLRPIDSPGKAAAAVWLAGKELRFQVSKDGEGKGGLQSAFVRKVHSGFEVIVGQEDSEVEPGRDQCAADITLRISRITLLVRHDGSLEEIDRSLVSTDEYTDEDACQPHGRRPERFEDRASGRTLGGHLARAMHHEAESVRAFKRLARELEAFGAPRFLIGRARRAADDEYRHAHMVGALGRQLGLELVPVIARDELPVRLARDTAVENAVEGCVFEAFAAAVATHQAAHAKKPALRAHYASIAMDEMAHAALAFATHGFLGALLSREEAREVERHKQRARAELATSLREPDAIESFLGFPSVEMASALLHAIDDVAVIEQAL